MSIPIDKPSVFSTEEIRTIPDLALLADAVIPLYDMVILRHISQNVGNSHEHTYPLAQYARDAIPSSFHTFDRYSASAFDEGTVQDLKHHSRAVEIYLALKGKFSIKWKAKGPVDFETKNILEVSACNSDWAVIPSEHCLLVTANEKEPFLAIAFKSEKSKTGNGKIRATDCVFFKPEEEEKKCPKGQVCWNLEKTRCDFFDNIEQARKEAVKKVNDIIRAL